MFAWMAASSAAMTPGTGLRRTNQQVTLIRVQLLLDKIRNMRHGYSYWRNRASGRRPGEELFDIVGGCNLSARRESGRIFLFPSPVTH